LRFLVDENLPRRLVGVLTAHGHEAVHVADEPGRGTDDDELWARAGERSEVLVTRDLDFPLPVGAHRPAGLVLFRLGTWTRGETIIRRLEEVLDSLEPDDLTGHVTVVEPARLRQRPLLTLYR